SGKRLPFRLRLVRCRGAPNAYPQGPPASCAPGMTRSPQPGTSLLMQPTHIETPALANNGQLVPDRTALAREATLLGAARRPRRPGIGKGIVLGLVFVGVLVFGAYLSGLPLPGLSRSGQDEKTVGAPPPMGVRLVPNQRRSIEVPEGVRTALGIRRGDRDQV